jgi:putative transcriptional regulator
MANRTNNPYFEGIRAGLEEVVSSFETGRKLTCRTIRLPEAPPAINSEQIANLRQEKLHLSQNVFASVLNVSLKTVQAWEQGRNTPCGPALRLLWLLAARPDVLTPILAAPEISRRGKG